MVERVPSLRSIFIRLKTAKGQASVAVPPHRCETGGNGPIEGCIGWVKNRKTWNRRDTVSHVTTYFFGTGERGAGWEGASFTLIAGALEPWGAKEVSL